MQQGARCAKILKNCNCIYKIQLQNGAWHVTGRIASHRFGGSSAKSHQRRRPSTTLNGPEFRKANKSNAWLRADRRKGQRALAKRAVRKPLANANNPIRGKGWNGGTGDGCEEGESGQEDRKRLTCHSRWEMRCDELPVEMELGQHATGLGKTRWRAGRPAPAKCEMFRANESVKLKADVTGKHRGELENGFQARWAAC